MRTHLAATIACILLVAGVLKAQQPAEAPNAEALLQSAKASLDAGLYPEAEAAYRKVAALEPANPRGLMGVTAVYIAQKKYDEAIALLQDASRKNPARIEYHMSIGEVALGSGKYDLAVSEFLLVLNRTARNTRTAGELYYRIGQAYLGQGKIDFAIIFLRQAQDLLPGDAKVLATFALVLEAAGQKEAAERAYRVGLDISPDDPAILNNLAFLICEHGGNLDTALTYARRAHEVAPNAVAITDTLGWVLLKKNLTDEAIALFRECVQKEPARSTFRYHLAVALEQKGDHAAALEELQTALKSSPPKDEEPKIRELMAKIAK